MAQRSDELKHEIEQTREQMGETADALAYKADVPTRTKEWIGDKKDAVVSAVTGATSKVGDVTPDGEQVTYSMGRMKRVAERNPLGLAIGGAAVGFIAGVSFPRRGWKTSASGQWLTTSSRRRRKPGERLSTAGSRWCRTQGIQRSRPQRKAVARKVRNCRRACRPRSARATKHCFDWEEIAVYPSWGRRASRVGPRACRPLGSRERSDDRRRTPVGTYRTKSTTTNRTASTTARPQSHEAPERWRRLRPGSRSLTLLRYPPRFTSTPSRGLDVNLPWRISEVGVWRSRRRVYEALPDPGGTHDPPHRPHRHRVATPL